MERTNGKGTHAQRGRQAARWLASALTVGMVAACGLWPARRVAADENATSGAVSSAGAHSHFMDLLQGEYDPDLNRFVYRHEPSAEFLQCVEPIDQTMEEDGIRVTMLEAISDGRYLAVYMEIENLVPWDWSMADVNISAQANGKAALSIYYYSNEAMWIPYVLHPDDETRTMPHPWFGIFELPEGAAGQVTVKAEVRIFRPNGPLVMLAPNLYTQTENADDTWPDLFRAQMEAYGIVVAGEHEMDATAWAQDGYIPIAGGKFALDEGHELLPGAAEARGEITHTGTVNMTFAARGNAGASAARELVPGGEYALGSYMVWIDSVFVSPVLVSLEMRSTLPNDGTHLSPGTLLADGAGNLLEWESVTRFVSSHRAYEREEDGAEPLYKYDMWATPGPYLSAEKLIVAIMTPEQRYGGMKTVADLEREGIEYIVIPLDGAEWTAAGFPLAEEIPEALDMVTPSEGGAVQYIPIPMETRAP